MKQFYTNRSMHKIMYNPPSKTNWYSVGFFNESYARAYNEGYMAAKNKSPENNPYKPSGHERDTTFYDEMNYYWYKGFEDYDDYNNNL